MAAPVILAYKDLKYTAAFNYGESVMGWKGVRLTFARFKGTMGAFALLWAMSTQLLANPAPTGRADFEICQACHGVDGQGNQALGAPRIAGLEAGYVARQLENFRRGLRGADPDDVAGAQMAEMAKGLADEAAVSRVAAFVASLPETSASATITGDGGKGQKLFATCAACHGQRGEGNAVLGAPRLAGMTDWYLLRQLEAFRAGKRGNLAADTAGATMRAATLALPADADLKDVIAHIASFAAAAATTASPAATAGSAITLRSDCPASFERVDGRCRFVSLYQLYAASPAQGGGLRVPLPPLHDGFKPALADLGRYLFFDPLLSRDGRVSCAHCHHPDLGLADGRRTSMGLGGIGLGPGRAGGASLRRAAPTLWNVGFLERLFWDGRASSLQEQAQGPLFSADEMGNSPQELLKALSGVPEYRRLFAQAFEREVSSPITVRDVLDALAAFECSLVSINSRYDRYAHGDAEAMTEQETQGYNVFRGFVARCSQCHVPPLFASSDVAVVGAPGVAGRPYDDGAAEKHGDFVLRGAFKVPTLRNVALTAPYFQAGQFSSLEEVIAFYNDRAGHALPPGANLQIHWHLHMKQPELSAADAAALVAFLHALTDESLLPRIPGAVPSGLPIVAHLAQLTARKP